MSNETEVLVLASICVERNGVNKKICKGQMASLTDDELDHFVNLDVVERPKFKAADLKPKPEPKAKAAKGGDS